MFRQSLSIFGLAALVLAGCDGIEPPSRHDVGGARVHAVAQGTGQPAVVFESGLGDGKDVWSQVFSPITAKTTAFAYDRPGYARGQGFLDRYDSDRDGVRTGEEVARNLRALLHEQGIAAPYVLVGHSIGGTYMLSYARLFPEEVAGLVLVDTRLPGFTGRCEAANVGPCRPPKMLTPLQPWPVQGELRGVEQSERQAARARDLAGIPVTVITSSKKPSMGSAELQRLWMSMQRQYATDAANGRFVVATGSGHYIQKERPNLVISEIQRLVDANRQGAR